MNCLPEGGENTFHHHFGDVGNPTARNMLNDSPPLSLPKCIDGVLLVDIRDRRSLSDSL